MKLTDDAAARQIDPATMATWIDLASINGDATVYRVYWSDDDTYHVVEHPEGPRPVVLAVSEHGDYVTALRAVAAVIEEDELSAGQHVAATPLDVMPSRRTESACPGCGLGLERPGAAPGVIVTEHALGCPEASEEEI